MTYIIKLSKKYKFSFFREKKQQNLLHNIFFIFTLCNISLLFAFNIITIPIDKNIFI